MSGEALFVVGVLAVAVILFASDRVRLDVVALLVVLALIVSDVLTVKEALAGFGDSVVLMIAGLFVVGEGLVTTGIAYALGDWLMRVGGASETRLLVLLMVVVAGIGAFMSSTGIVAIFIPVVLSIAAKTGFRRAGLLMPLAFAALISGMMTLIATPPNLVVNAELRRWDLEPFGFFDFTPIGVLVLIVGVLYILFVGRRLLVTRDESGDARRDGRTLEQLATDYGMIGRLYRLRLGPNSPLAGQTIGVLRLRTRFGVMVVGVERAQGMGTQVMPALAHTEFKESDVVYVVGQEQPMTHFIEALGLQRLVIDERSRKDIVQELGLAEVMLAPSSKLIGRTLGEAAFRTRHGLTVLAIKRRGQPIEASVVGEKLQFGDSLLVCGSWKQIGRLQADKKDFLVLSLPVEIDEVAPARSKAPAALVILLGMIALMTFGVVANVAAVLIAALAMVAVRCVSMDAAYKVINWQSLVLIAGMLPLATALDKTGGTRFIAEELVGGLGDLGPYAMMAGLFVLTAVIGMFVSNTATAVLLAPIAIGAAQLMDVSPYPYVMTVAISSSAAFMTPVSSPVNTLVVAPGHYRFSDFVKVGVPMVLLVMAVTLLAVPMLFPL